MSLQEKYDAFKVEVADLPFEVAAAAKTGFLIGIGCVVEDEESKGWVAESLKAVDKEIEEERVKLNYSGA